MLKTSPSQQQHQDGIGLIDKYIEIWKNMGFDFNCNPPNTSNSLTKEGSSYDPVNEIQTLEYVVDKINAEVKKHGKKYELMVPLKIVTAYEVRFEILKFNVWEFPTFDIKTVEAFVFEGPGPLELIEWRIKDGPREAPPPGFPCPEIAPLGTPFPKIPPPEMPSPDISPPPSPERPSPDPSEAPSPLEELSADLDEIVLDEEAPSPLEELYADLDEIVLDEYLSEDEYLGGY